MKKPILLMFFLLLVYFLFASNTNDELIDLLYSEIEHQMSELENEEIPPYYISYRVKEVTSIRINATFGNLTGSRESTKRTLTVEVRVGSNERDNTHELRDDLSIYLSYFQFGAKFPLTNDPDAIRQALWRETNKKYIKAIDKLAKVNANVAVKVDEEDKSSDFSIDDSYTYFEPLIESEQFEINWGEWEDRVKKYSRPFLDDESIFNGYSGLRFNIERKYFVSTEGGKITQNMTSAFLSIGGSIKSEDGMVSPLYKSYFSYKPENLPTDEVVMQDVEKMVRTLTALKNAPVVESFTGPALLSGEAAGVFFHEIFGHRVEGQRLKSETDAQTFKKKIGEKVLSEHLSVIFEPLRDEYLGQDLFGYYKYDDQGMKAQEVTIVENGILKGFLMSRCPIEGFDHSNGHGRAEAGKQPVTRQSNLIVKTNKPLSAEALRKKMIDELKEQEKEYGYLFQSVMGGFTMTGRYIPNAFNVTPTEVYKIYADGRPDELVRGVNLVGTPLAMFSQVAEAGDTPEVFTGFCGAESGRVPVTAISPALFVKRIETQKKIKSQERPPILPRPDLDDEELN
jgi:predicted Zn-dependent protease